jgi:hypothetical protein
MAGENAKAAEVVRGFLSSTFYCSNSEEMNRQNVVGRSRNGIHALSRRGFREFAVSTTHKQRILGDETMRQHIWIVGKS